MLQARSSHCKGLEAENVMCWHEEGDGEREELGKAGTPVVTNQKYQTVIDMWHGGGGRLWVLTQGAEPACPSPWPVECLGGAGMGQWLRGTPPGPFPPVFSRHSL